MCSNNVGVLRPDPMHAAYLVPENQILPRIGNNCRGHSTNFILSKYKIADTYIRSEGVKRKGEYGNTLQAQ
jgi:hypothetical protein